MYARIVSGKFGTEHHEYLVRAQDCLEVLPGMIRHFDEPFGNSSAIPTYFCARLASQNGVSVLLAGDGGDELFGGNSRYRDEIIFELYQAVPRTLRKAFIEPVLRYLPLRQELFVKARKYVSRSNLPNPQRYYSYNLLGAFSPAEVFESDFLASLENYSVLDIPSAYYRQAPAHNHLNRLLYLDVKITLGDNDLCKVTRMSEMAGIKARFPLLDLPVAEFSGTIPASLKVKKLENRYLFKQAFRNLLPAEVIQKTKHGFGIPVAHWLKSDPRLRELSRDVLLGRRTFERGYVRRTFVERLFRSNESEETSYYGDMLWSLLTLELWHRQFVDQTAQVVV